MYNENIYKFSIPFANTVTFQTSYFIRACKTWNILDCALRHRDIGLNTLNQNLRHIMNTRYPKYTIVTIHAHGSP